jgi:heptaprenyl diphosphate synthase
LRNKNTASKIAFLSISIALAMILAFVESRIPSPLPGVKIGLPNIVIVFILYKFSWKEAIITNLTRVLLVNMLFGNVQSLMLGLSGAILSLLGMILLKKWFAPTTVSVVGGILHNIGQVGTACILMQTAGVVAYLPFLLVSGIIAGVLIGIISAMLLKKLEKLKF